MRTVRYIKMAANKMQIVNIFTQQYIAVYLTDKNVPSETAASGLSNVEVRTKSTRWSKPSAFFMGTDQINQSSITHIIHVFSAIDWAWSVVLRKWDKNNTEIN